MMNAYRELLQRRDDQLLQMQAYAAAADDEVRAYVRKREACLYAEVLALTAGDADKARDWIAYGLLWTVGAVLDLPEFMK